MSTLKILIKKSFCVVTAALLLTGCNAKHVEPVEESRFGDFAPVMEEGGEFFLFGWKNDNITLEEYGKEIAAEGAPEIDRYTFVDLDGQNGDELIVHTSDGGGNFIIFSEIEGKIYGVDMAYRTFEELQKDGKYLASGGAGDNYFYTMTINKDGFTENLFAEQHGETAADGTYSYNLVVDGNPVDDYEAWYAENYSDPAEWSEY